MQSTTDSQGRSEALFPEIWGSVCPVHPIGADGLAGQDHTQGGRLRHPEDATAGSALDCDPER